MQAIIKVSPTTYDTDDVIDFVDDDHVWGKDELDTTQFKIITAVNVDTTKALSSHVVVKTTKAVRKITPLFFSTKIVKKRRYTLSKNILSLKNAL